MDKGANFNLAPQNYSLKIGSSYRKKFFQLTLNLNYKKINIFGQLSHITREILRKSGNNLKWQTRKLYDKCQYTFHKTLFRSTESMKKTIYRSDLWSPGADGFVQFLKR